MRWLAYRIWWHRRRIGQTYRHWRDQGYAATAYHLSQASAREAARSLGIPHRYREFLPPKAQGPYP